MFCNQNYVLVNGLCDFPNTQTSTCGNGHLEPDEPENWVCYEDSDFIIYGRVGRDNSFNRDQAHDYCQSLDSSGRSTLAQIVSDNEKENLWNQLGLIGDDHAQNEKNNDSDRTRV